MNISGFPVFHIFYVLLESNQHLVYKFQNITTVVVRKAAEHVLKRNQWNLNRALDCFYEHRHDDDNPDLKRDLRTEDEVKQEKIGMLIQHYKEKNFQPSYIHLQNSMS